MTAGMERGLWAMVLFLLVLAPASRPRQGQAGSSPADEGFLLLDRANRLREEGKVAESINTFQGVIKIAAKAELRDRPLLLFGAYRGLTLIDLVRRDFAAAQADVEKARQVSSAERIDTEDFVSELMHAASKEAREGEILATLTVLRLVLTVAPGDSAAGFECFYRTELAEYHLYLTELQQALRESELAAAAAEKIAPQYRTMAVVRVLVVRGKIFEELGDDESGLRSYEGALNLLTPAWLQGLGNSFEDLWFLVKTYTGAASAQIRNHDFTTAERTLNQATRLAQQMGDADGAITVAKTRGDLEYARGNVALAIAEYVKSIDKGAEFTAKVRHLGFGTAGENLAMLEMFGEGCLAGKDFFPGTDQIERIQFHAALGAQLGMLGKNNEALCEMGRAVPEIEQLRTVVDEPRFRRSVFKSTVDVYSDIVRLLFASQHAVDLKIPVELAQYGSDPRAIGFRFAEAARARTFVERLGPALAASYDVKDERLASLLGQERRTRGSLRAILDLDTLPTDDPEATSMEARATRIASLRQQLESDVRQIRAANASVARLLYPDPVGMQDVRGLGGADALIEYMVTPTAIYCWVITRNGDGEWFRFDCAREDLRSSVAKLRDPMERRDFQQFDDSLAKQLYATLLKGPLRWIDAHGPVGGTAAEPRLVIVPDDALYLLPFEILENVDGRFFGERYITSYSPSATAFAQLKTISQSAHWTSELLLVGDSLSPGQHITVPGVGEFKGSPGDSLEIDSLSELFGVGKNCLDVVTGACSDKKTLLARGLRMDLKGYRYVHFSTHAFAYSRFPEPSLIMFARPGEPGSALLSMSEIPALHLQSRLVTLSACQSALGQERNPIPGEGIVGLTQAFFYAGTQSVISSLWEVEGSSTLNLMKAFYTELRVGTANDPAIALFHARTQVSQKGGTQNRISPYFWGGFVIYGAQMPTPR
jgi:CHAT domain-containing protein/tetratricopeptide (TPR) repeat protein